jgi:hypothetical protein
VEVRHGARCNEASDHEGAIAGTNMIAIIATTIAVAYWRHECARRWDLLCTSLSAAGFIELFVLVVSLRAHRPRSARDNLQPPKGDGVSAFALLKFWTQITLGRSEWVQIEQLQSSARARGVKADHTVP